MFLKSVAVLPLVLMVLSPVPVPAHTQAPPSQAEQGETRRTLGTVVSAGRGSIVLRTEAGQFEVFAVTADTVRVRRIRAGDRVNVATMIRDAETPATAVVIDILADGPAAGTPRAPVDAAAIPPEIRRLEAQIERQVRKYRIGALAGASLDPELILVGAHSTFGPIFRPDITFRPGVEIGFGEVTTLVAIHLDVLYQFAGSRQTRWTPYIGAGPNFSFSHRSFEGESDGNRFDFGDFDGETAFNLIAGARTQSGVFIELKATASGVANVRLLSGFAF